MDFQKCKISITFQLQNNHCVNRTFNYPSSASITAISHPAKLEWSNRNETIRNRNPNLFIEKA